MTPADEIKQAAEKLRTLATAATPGPWRQTGIGDYGWSVSFSSPGAGVEADDSDQGRADADYIAAMDPTVGLLLADWLDEAARYYEAGVRAAADVFRDDPAGREAFLTTGPGAPSVRALAIARALNTQP